METDGYFCEQEHKCKGTVHNACRLVKNFVEHKQGDEVYKGWNIIMPRIRMKKIRGKKPIYRKDIIKTLGDFKFCPYCGEELL